MRKKLKCSICKEEHGDRFGHNADPINDGRCCAVCNTTVVVPMRLRIFFDSIDKTKIIEESVKTGLKSANNIKENNDGI